MIKPFFKDIRQEIIKELKSAKAEINVAVCWFTSNELFEALCDRLSEIPVNLIVLNDAINNKPDGLDFQKFIELGGKFYFGDIENPMHNKYCIIDGSTVINGSYNWTYFAENKNHENITIIRDEVMASEFLLDFKRLTEECKLVTKVKDVASTDTKQITIVEDVQIASKGDIIIKSRVDFVGSELTLKNSIGTRVMGDRFIVMIPKNSKIPIEKMHTFTTSKDNQVSVYNDIRFGESSTSSLNEGIGYFIFDDIPPLPKGTANFIDTFSIDSNGILTVRVFCETTNRTVIETADIRHLINGLV